MYHLTGKKVWVAGHGGMVGSALIRRLQQEKCTILQADRRRYDLRRQDHVEAWMKEHRPQAIFLAAAKVGGIHANNSRPVDFLHDNLAITLHVLHAAAAMGVEKLLFLGSSCIYPAQAQQPIREEELLNGPLEPTNQWYAIAKIAGIKLCQAYRQQKHACFISAMPTNLYGPWDNFHPTDSHVPAALLRRFHEAVHHGHSSVTVWGSGTPKREFLHVDDLADACVFLMQNYDHDMPINVGTGEDITIANFARIIAALTKFSGNIVFDQQRPDGMKRKCLDISRLRKMGWHATIPLEKGLKNTYTWLLSHPEVLKH